jgi:shikimate dehydrogenase
MAFSPSSHDVLTLADLGRLGEESTWLAVLGQPIAHSLSPVLHQAALAEMARTVPAYSNWQYVRFEVAPADLPQALRQLHARRFRGLNLTIPHKILAVTEVVQIDPPARLAGAVNTLRWTPQGWEGFNTDGFGLATGLKTDLGAELAGAKVILLGAGGAARGAALECISRGCAELWIGNRSAESLDALSSLLAPLAEATRLHRFDLAHLPTELPSGAWVINSTSAGLKESDAAPIDLRQVPAPAGVYDMVYRPPQTALLREAERLGIPFANGLSMLIHQGARALEIWTGAKVPVAAMENAVKNLRITSG